MKLKNKKEQFDGKGFQTGNCSPPAVSFPGVYFQILLENFP